MRLANGEQLNPEHVASVEVVLHLYIEGAGCSDALYLAAVKTTDGAEHILGHSLTEGEAQQKVDDILATLRQS